MNKQSFSTSPIQLERLIMTHIVSRASALNALTLPDGVRLLRIAPDEAYVHPPMVVQLEDEWAIVTADSGMAGAVISAEITARLLERHCEWEPPTKRPALAQGLVAGIPTKLWFETEQTLWLVPASFSAEMEERLRW